MCPLRRDHREPSERASKRGTWITIHDALVRSGTWSDCSAGFWHRFYWPAGNFLERFHLVRFGKALGLIEINVAQGHYWVHLRSHSGDGAHLRLGVRGPRVNGGFTDPSCGELAQVKECRHGGQIHLKLIFHVAIEVMEESGHYHLNSLNYLTDETHDSHFLIRRQALHLRRNCVMMQVALPPL